MVEAVLKLREFFEATIIPFEQNFKLKADYTHKSLEDLEQTLDEMYPKGTMARDTTIFATGYYVGEIFVRNIPGAAWDDTIYENNPFTVTLQLEDKLLMVDPREMVRDYIRHPGNSMSRIFTFYKEVAEGRRSIEDKLPGMTYTMYGG